MGQSALFEDFGACCACRQVTTSVRNFTLLPYRAPKPGTGWGCVQCDLPLDGAMAVVCDRCANKPGIDESHLQDVIYGVPVKRMRYPMSLLTKTEFLHDLSKHPEEVEVGG